jgi:hypothetical protein
MLVDANDPSTVRSSRRRMGTVNSVRSQAQTVVDAQVGYETATDWRLRLDIFNLFNSQTNDVAYFYESRLPGKPNGVEDIHFHPQRATQRALDPVVSVLMQNRTRLWTFSFAESMRLAMPVDRDGRRVAVGPLTLR